MFLPNDPSNQPNRCCRSDAPKDNFRFVDLHLSGHTSGVPMHATVERLDPRRMLSGNVTVTTGPGFTATLVGDNGGDAFDITLEKGVGYRVSGRDKTTINGQSAVLIKSASALDFTVVTGVGKDRINFNGAFGTQNLTIYSGGGDDQISIQGTTQFGNLVISASGGNDKISLGQITVTQSVVIWTSIGNDTVDLTAANITGAVGISTSTGNDRITLTDSHISKSFCTCTGSGNDELRFIDSGVSGNVGISMSDGDDKLTFSEVHIKRSLGIITSRGNDAITLDKSVLIDGDAFVFGGSGNNALNGSDQLTVKGHSFFVGFSSSKHHDDDDDHHHHDEDHDEDHDD
jgi:hypothetical protein